MRIEQKAYIVFTDEDRAVIGKHAAIKGNSSTKKRSLNLSKNHTNKNT